MLVDNLEDCHVDYFFIGGSLLKNPDISYAIEFLKRRTNIPQVIFPGNGLYINNAADAVLFLSLISGRNPELLIGQHVSVASSLKKSGIEVIPTGYILIDGGRTTSVSYLSFTSPIPNDKPDIVSSTAVAGELLGMKMIYLEAGSGANYPVSVEIVDVIVVGNKIEQNPGFIKDVSYVLKKYNESLNVH
jgi:putative glycerol-1-phosphate prenyltransferase